jgi:pilus assembly protein CpaD
MARTAFHIGATGTPAPVAGRRRKAALLTAFAVGLLAGCANRDSITVGSVPDDYRTNHPIMIAEKEEVLDLPVAAGDRGMTHSHKTAIDGFLDSYDRSAMALITITVPSGSGNEIAAADVAGDFRRFIRSRGIPQSRIAMASYQAPSVEVSAPVRLSYTAMRAQTNKCGRWPDDVLNDSENKHYANFGCAYQNNLAAQVANPSDLLGPRKQTEVDAENRDRVIDVYRNRGVSGEFLDNSEIDIDF